MKNLIYLVLLILLIACSSSREDEENQEYNYIPGPNAEQEYDQRLAKANVRQSDLSTPEGEGVVRDDTVCSSGIRLGENSLIDQICIGELSRHVVIRFRMTCPNELGSGFLENYNLTWKVKDQTGRAKTDRNGLFLVSAKLRLDENQIELKGKSFSRKLRIFEQGYTISLNKNECYPE